MAGDCGRGNGGARRRRRRRAVPGGQRHDRGNDQGRVGGAAPGVTVTVHNTDTGAERVVVTDANGLYRAPLLPLGTYQVTAELAGFKKHSRPASRSPPAPSAVINIAMEVGGVSEVVSRPGRRAGRRSRQDRRRPQPQRARDQQPAAGLAQPVQLRAAPARCQRLRELGVRRARASAPTARCCASTTRWTATPTRRRIAPACA